MKNKKLIISASIAAVAVALACCIGFKLSSRVPKEEPVIDITIPLKDNISEAKRQVEKAMNNLIKEAYGDKVVDSRINEIKIYNTAEENATEVLKEMNLGPNEVAFEVQYELKPAEGVNWFEFTAGTGDYDEETGWVVEKSNLGILVPNDDGTSEYKITNFGTGW